jgi:hypothetical protein
MQQLTPFQPDTRFLGPVVRGALLALAGAAGRLYFDGLPQLLRGAADAIDRQAEGVVVTTIPSAGGIIIDGVTARPMTEGDIATIPPETLSLFSSSFEGPEINAASGEIEKIDMPAEGSAAAAFPLLDGADTEARVRFVGGALPWLAIGPDGEPITQATRNPTRRRPKRFKSREKAEAAAFAACGI